MLLARIPALVACSLFSTRMQILELVGSAQIMRNETVEEVIPEAVKGPGRTFSPGKVAGTERKPLRSFLLAVIASF